MLGKKRWENVDYTVITTTKIGSGYLLTLKYFSRKFT